MVLLVLYSTYRSKYETFGSSWYLGRNMILRFFTVPWSKYDAFGCSWYLGRNMILSYFHSTLVQNPKEGKQMGGGDGSPVSS